MHRLIFYYLGTVAFGSCLVAIMQFVRAALAYLHRQMKAQGKDNNTVRWIMCCVQCCMACMQKCVEMINRNAYIYTAVKGTGFCTSGAAAFRLIVANAATFAAVTVLSEIIMWLGKVMIGECASLSSEGQGPPRP